MKSTLINPICEFGIAVKTELLVKNKTQQWLIEEIKHATGLYVDGSLLHKVLVGKNHNPKLISAIEKILNIKKED